MSGTYVAAYPTGSWRMNSTVSRVGASWMYGANQRSWASESLTPFVGRWSFWRLTPPLDATYWDTPDLRLYALRRLGEQDDPQVVEQLVQMYDGERDAQVKVTLIRAFGDSHQKVALRKLIAIARSDQSVELRKLAVRQLGESKDPEALRFLEELLK